MEETKLELSYEKQHNLETEPVKKKKGLWFINKIQSIFSSKQKEVKLYETSNFETVESEELKESIQYQAVNEFTPYCNKYDDEEFICKIKNYARNRDLLRKNLKPQEEKNI